MVARPWGFESLRPHRDEPGKLTSEDECMEAMLAFLTDPEVPSKPGVRVSNVPGP